MKANQGQLFARAIDQQILGGPYGFSCADKQIMMAPICYQQSFAVEIAVHERLSERVAQPIDP
jgi:hypothetical protein